MGARRMKLVARRRRSRARFLTALAGGGMLYSMATFYLGTAPTLAGASSRHTATFGSALTSPGGLAVDSAGDLFATDFSPVSGSVGELHADRSGGYGPAAVLPFGNTLGGATGVTVDSSGDVFVANEVANTVVELPANGATGYGAPTTLPLAPDVDGPDGLRSILPATCSSRTTALTASSSCYRRPPSSAPGSPA